MTLRRLSLQTVREAVKIPGPGADVWERDRAGLIDGMGWQAEAVAEALGLEPDWVS